MSAELRADLLAEVYAQEVDVDGGGNAIYYTDWFSTAGISKIAIAATANGPSWTVQVQHAIQPDPSAEGIVVVGLDSLPAFATVGIPGGSMTVTGGESVLPGRFFRVTVYDTATFTFSMSVRTVE